MAIINSIAVGKGRGKLGNMVLSTTKGRCIAREYNPSVLNPKTPAQMAQRNRMQACVGLYQKIAPALEHAFINRNKKMSVYNAFVKANVAKMPDYEYTGIEDIETNYSDVKIANGALGDTSFTWESGEAVINFSSCKTKLKVGDKVVLFYADMEGKNLQIIEDEITEANLETGVRSIDLDAPENGGFLGAYIYTADKKASSTSKILIFLPIV